MRLVIGLLVGALAALTLPSAMSFPQQSPRQGESSHGYLVFRGRLARLDGVDIPHSQLVIVMRARTRLGKPFSYRLALECEDLGIEFSPGKDRSEQRRWGSFYSPDSNLPAYLTPEYRCPAADPARFARVTAILNARSSLEYQEDDHAEFQSDIGSVRFHSTPSREIL